MIKVSFWAQGLSMNEVVFGHSKTAPHSLAEQPAMGAQNMMTILASLPKDDTPSQYTLSPFNHQSGLSAGIPVYPLSPTRGKTSNFESLRVHSPSTRARVKRPYPPRLSDWLLATAAHFRVWGLGFGVCGWDYIRA